MNKWGYGFDYFFSKEPHISSCLGFSEIVSYNTERAELVI
jgi:hypothetical protein